MKQKILFLLCAVILGTAFTSCSNGESSKQSEASRSESSDATNKNEPDLSALHGVKGNDKIAGSWKITGGAGSQLKSFTYCFDGKGECYMAIGNMCTCSSYNFSTKEGQELFTAHLVFGIEGDYTYSFSDDGKKAELVSSDGQTTTVIEKVEDYNPIPVPEKNPVIDEKLVGAWADKNGEYLYFGKNGIMYQSQIGTSFTFANYSSKDGKLTETYTMTDTVNDKAEYKVNGDILTYNNYQYSKINVSELK